MAQSNIRARTRTIQESVDSKAERLTTLARQHGLTTEDIDDCIIQSLRRVQAERWWFLPKFWAKLAKGMIILVVMCLCLLVIIVNHKPSKHYLDLLSFNTSYPAMRVVRLLTLPLARQVDLSRIYNAECALPNPLYTGDFDVDCYPCQFVTHVQTIQGTSSQYSFGRPFLLKDPKINQLTYDDMKTWYHFNKKIFNLARADHFQSSNPYIHSISNVFADEIKEEDIEMSSLSLEWRAASAGSVRLMRILCGKPSFIPPESEVFPEMFLFIESSSSYAHHLPKPVFLGYIWLSQAHGSREIVLSPVAECKTNCTEISVVLEPGHVLFLDMRYWELQSFPFGDDVSISCMGSYA